VESIAKRIKVTASKPKKAMLDE